MQSAGGGRLRPIAQWTLLIACAVCASTARADVQPRTFVSPNGHFALRVDPSDRNGAGQAHYELKRDDKVLWSGDRSFTWVDAFVTDAGISGGYAYTAGIERDAGEFLVALIDARGVTRSEDKTPREGSLFLHTAPDPKATGLFVQPENQRFVVRVDDPDVNVHSEAWWSYALDDGHLIGRTHPRDALAAAIRDLHPSVAAAQPVPGTALTLVHWVTMQDGAGCCVMGALFALIDAHDKPVWTLALPRDYNKPGDERAEARLIADIRRDGAILGVSAPGRFVIRHAAQDQRVAYAVSRDASPARAWHVTETGRTPFAAAAPTSTSLAASVRAVQLPTLGTIDLHGRTPRAGTWPVHDVSDFVPAGDGRFGLIGRCGCGNDGAHSLVIVDGAGKLLREIALPPLPPGTSFADHAAWLGKNDWLVTTSTGGEDAVSSAVRIDAGSGQVTPLPGFSAPAVESLAALPDGGFVALIRRDETYTSKERLVGFDAQGRERWAFGEGDGAGQLFSAEGVTVTSRGEVVVLENISNKLKIYSAQGEYRRTIDLGVAWRRKPEYLAGIQADTHGGVIVHDFAGTPSIVHMQTDGTVLDTLTPVFPDAHHFDIRGDVKMSADGSDWTSDGVALLRLDDHGKVDRVLGDKPDVTVLDRIAAIAITRAGAIYAADERTGAVHVFDAAGEHQRVCRPEPEDYARELSFPSLSVNDAGEVTISRHGSRDQAHPDFLRYDARCKRVGVERLATDDFTQSWYAQPGGTNRWVLGDTSAYLVDAQQHILRRIERRPDGAWVRPVQAGVAPDGSIALAGSRRAMDNEPLDDRVSIFARDATPVTSWPAPPDVSDSAAAMAFDGQRIAFVTRGVNAEKADGVIVTDARGNALYRSALAGLDYSAAVFFVQPTPASATELWVFDGLSTVRRLALP